MVDIPLPWIKFTGGVPRVPPRVPPGERQVPRVLSQSSECLRWNAALATRTVLGLEISEPLVTMGNLSVDFPIKHIVILYIIIIIYPLVNQQFANWKIHHV